MNRPFTNVYEDDTRARAYAALEFPGTYYLAFRDLPDILARQVRGMMALDFGCGAGRSSRFLKGLGYAVVGADISEAMLRRAVEADPGGDYLLIPNGEFGALGGRQFDVILCAFTFDNIPGMATRIGMFTQLGKLLSPAGRIINLVSAADIYVHEWKSFTTAAFPENRTARSGDIVRIVMKDVPDSRPVEDVFWTEADYRETFASAGLDLIETCRPLGRPSDGQPWVSEERVPPWWIHVLEQR